MIVVSDTSPFRALHFLGLIELLPTSFDRVLVPPAVRAELLAPRSGHRPSIDVSGFPFVDVRGPSDALVVRELRRKLDPGEAEAIAVAIEANAGVLIDEARGRREAERRGIQWIGAVGVLIEGKRLGRVTAVRPLLDRLQKDLGFIGDSFRERALRLAGE